MNERRITFDNLGKFVCSHIDIVLIGLTDKVIQGLLQIIHLALILRIEIECHLVWFHIFGIGGIVSFGIDAGADFLND